MAAIIRGPSIPARHKPDRDLMPCSHDDHATTLRLLSEVLLLRLA